MRRFLSQLFAKVNRPVQTRHIRLRGPKRQGETEHNIWYLYVEVFWAAILSAAASFNATYAVRLGASNAMIGWLSSVPALLAVFLLVPSARFLERKTQRAPWIWGSLLIARLGYGLIAVLPWLTTAHRAEAVVGLLIAISIPNTFFSAGFNPLLADVVPERDRARVFGNRNIIAGLTVAVLTFLAGQWLEAAKGIHWATFPTNYQVMYIIGFLASLVSTVYLLKIKVPESQIVERPPRQRMSLTQIKAMFGQNRNFARITLNTLIFGFGDWLVAPLYIIFFLRYLHATDGWVGLNSTLANIGVIIGYAFWQRLIYKWGDARTLLVAVPLSASYAFLVSLFPNLTAILVWGVLINIINPGVNLSHFNILLKLCPEERRASYIAFYSTIINMGAFVGPLIGVALSRILDIRLLLLIGGSIRLTGALMFHVFPIRLETREDLCQTEELRPS
ncbi:MAG TPA: MFS transporter [Anaerolineae bacterium]|nr:MFS transporter [Anaerolineae bacterium]HQH39149.1 MFS transporter [Anaerolineae bacterium]